MNSELHLMTKEQSVAIAGKAIASQSVVIPNPIEFAWVEIVAEEFMRRYNKIAHEGHAAWTRCNEEWSQDYDKDQASTEKFFEDNLKP